MLFFVIDLPQEYFILIFNNPGSLSLEQLES